MYIVPSHGIMDIAALAWAKKSQVTNQTNSSLSTLSNYNAHIGANKSSLFPEIKEKRNNDQLFQYVCISTSPSPDPF